MKILIADDDAVSRELAARLLRKWNYEVLTVEDGRAALEILRAPGAPRLALLDWMMPQLDGPGVCRELRLNPLAAYVYVVLLTSKDDKQDVVEGLDSGADDYLTKPFDFAELVVRVKSLLRRTPVERTDVILVSNLELNRLTHQVRRGGQNIELTSKEYALLEYLLSSPSRVFTRSMILEHVWDQSFEGVTNIVDVYVRHLRRKVDDPFPVKLIHTVRGVGYCVRETQQVAGPQVQ